MFSVLGGQAGRKEKWLERIKWGRSDKKREEMGTRSFPDYIPFVARLDETEGLTPSLGKSFEFVRSPGGGRAAPMLYRVPFFPPTENNSVTR